jgi:hypothetical protein
MQLDYIDDALAAKQTPIETARAFMRHPAERRKEIIDALHPQHELSRVDVRRRKLQRYILIHAHTGEITIND